MLNGSMVALITPMTPSGEVDYSSLKRLVSYHIEHHSDALVVLGTTGESATFELTEHVEVVTFVVKEARGQIPIIAGNGANSTRQAVALTQALSHLDLAAMLCVTPYYNKPSPDGLIAHFSAVADASDVPQILYNVPSRTGVDLPLEVLIELSEHPNIIGIKDATGDTGRVVPMRLSCGDDFLLLSGDDETAKDFIFQGGNGVISVVNNLEPALFKAMCAACLNGHWQQAQALHDRLLPLARDLFVEANPIPVKWAAYKQGLIQTPSLRLPLTTLHADNKRRVQEAMDAVQSKAYV
jgi:4-hydroxy-tetrahydrodipicolinate synthase